MDGTSSISSNNSGAPVAEPLQIVQLGTSPDGETRVVIVDENLARVAKNIQLSGADEVSIVAIMGKFRIGKSFLMNLVMRHLSWKASGHPDQDPSSGWAFGANDCQPPPWVGTDPVGGERASGSRQVFASRQDRKTVTLGIWLWSRPVVFQRDGRSVAVLLMDTQGVDDGHLATSHSATVFGLTAVLASKLMYNVQSRVCDADVSKLVFLNNFITIARSAGDKDVQFGDLMWVVRDYKHFTDGADLAGCQKEMEDEFALSTDDEGLSAERKQSMCALKDSFASMDCYCLPYPGRPVEQAAWDGSLQDVDKSFLYLVDRFVSRFFGSDFPPRYSPWGVGLTAQNFAERLRGLLDAFRNSESYAVSPGDAMLKLAASANLEALWAGFTQADCQRLSAEGLALPPSQFAKLVEELRSSFTSRLEAELDRWHPPDQQQQRQSYLDRLTQELQRRSGENELRVQHAVDQFQEKLMQDFSDEISKNLPWSTVVDPQEFAKMETAIMTNFTQRFADHLAHFEVAAREREEKAGAFALMVGSRMDSRREKNQLELEGASTKVFAFPAVGLGILLLVKYPVFFLFFLLLGGAAWCWAEMHAMGVSTPCQPEFRNGFHQGSLRVADQVGRALRAAGVAAGQFPTDLRKVADVGPDASRARMRVVLAVTIVAAGLCMVMGGVVELTSPLTPEATTTFPPPFSTTHGVASKSDDGQLLRDGKTIRSLQSKVASLHAKVENAQLAGELAKKDAADEVRDMRHDKDAAMKAASNAQDEAAALRGQLKSLHVKPQEGGIQAWVRHWEHQDLIASFGGLLGLAGVLGPTFFTKGFLAVVGSLVGGFIVAVCACYYVQGFELHSAVTLWDAAQSLLTYQGPVKSLAAGYSIWAALLLLGLARWISQLEYFIRVTEVADPPLEDGEATFISIKDDLHQPLLLRGSRSAGCPSRAPGEIPSGDANGAKC